MEDGVFWRILGKDRSRSGLNRSIKAIENITQNRITVYTFNVWLLSNMFSYYSKDARDLQFMYKFTKDSLEKSKNLDYSVNLGNGEFWRISVLENSGWG